MLKTKEQIAQHQRKKLAMHVEAVNNDIKGLSDEINYLNIRQKEINDVAPEAFNVLMGIQRDLRFGKERLRSLYQTVFK